MSAAVGVSSGTAYPFALRSAFLSTRLFRSYLLRFSMCIGALRAGLHLGH